jgi:hypothetical protein
VALRWNGWRGFDEAGFLVATIAPYNDPDGIARVPGAVDAYWHAFIRQQRLEGAFASEHEAKAAAEHAVGLGTPGPS